MSVLTLRALSKRYGRIQAVDGVNLTSGEGELLAILGPSGSGKSTIMRLVAGLEMPTSGDILIDGKSVLGIPPKDRNVAMVFQSFALYPHMSVRDNILFPLVARKVPKPLRQPKLDQVSRMLGIEDLLDRRPTRLSGGQQQKVALARALVRDPELFVFDEPLSSLDAKIRSQARAELRELHDRTGITMLYVTHDQIEAMTMADRVAVMRKGVLQQVDAPHELYDRPANLFVAGFIGESNRLGGIVEAVEADRVSVRLDDGALVHSRRANRTTPGEPATVAVRPEKLTFTDRLGAAANRVQARFIDSHYVGEFIRFHFETASGTPLVVKSLNDGSTPHLREREEVTLAWLPEDSQALDRPAVATTP